MDSARWEAYISPEACDPEDIEFGFCQLETHFKWLLKTFAGEEAPFVWRMEGLRPYRRILYSTGQGTARTALFYNNPKHGWLVVDVVDGWPA